MWQNICLIVFFNEISFFMFNANIKIYTYDYVNVINEKYDNKIMLVMIVKNNKY